MATGTTNKPAPQSSAPQPAPLAPAPETPPAVITEAQFAPAMLQIQELGAELRGVRKEMDRLGAVILERRHVAPQFSELRTLRQRPQVIPLSDGKRIVLSQVASYGPNGDKTAVEFRAANGAVLGFEETQKYEDNGPHGKSPIEVEKRAKQVEDILRSVDRLFAGEVD